MYVTLCGERIDAKPEGRHFVQTPDGVWHLQNASLPIFEIMDAFERLNMKSLQLLFDSAEQFWNTLESANFNLIHAGLDAEAICSRDEFRRVYAEMNNPLEKKLIYYYSIRHLNHVAQNIINHIMVSLGDAYAALSSENLHENVPLNEQIFVAGEGYRNSGSPMGFRIWTNINFCIEKSVSFLDFTSKYIADLSNIKPAMTSWKSKARDVTFGKWNHAKLARGTDLSDVSDELRLLIALRDETVHNGTIDHFSRVYEHTSGSRVKRRFLLLPDHDRGRLLTAAGRKRFFAQDNHLNEVLPNLLDKVFGDVLSSLNKIDERIEAQWGDLDDYAKRHSEMTNAVKMAEETGAFLKFIFPD